ncbi:hypothetical protein V2H77_20200 [Photorhabdus sp. P32]|uniref:hypothetical protein n=1 Tax=Photorhabdus sp. P32 TaxID=3117549 RepID=UPI00311B3E29
MKNKVSVCTHVEIDNAVKGAAIRVQRMNRLFLSTDGVNEGQQNAGKIPYLRSDYLWRI